MTSRAATLAIEDLVAHADWAGRLARALLGEAESDDVVQEAWIAALRARPNTDRPLRAWLRRVVQSRAFNRRRADARLRARHEEASALATDAAVTPEELVARMEVQRLLAANVVALPEPLRQTVLLRYYEDLTSTEIGRVMGVPPGTVRRRLKEGLEEIRQRLDRERGGDRTAWQRALLPLSVGGPAERTSRRTALASNLAIGVVVVGLIGGSAVLVSVNRGAGRPSLGEGRVEGAAQLGGASSSPNVRPRAGGAARANADLESPSGTGPREALPAAAVPSNIDECRRELAAMRTKLARHEAERRRRTKSASLFAEGSPNPVAREALLPDVERIMRPFAETTTFSFECRTWVCRVSFLIPHDARPAAWASLQRDAQLRPRIRGGSLEIVGLTKDAVSGARLVELAGYLGLADPSGKPIPLDLPRPGPTLDLPMPSKMADCVRELSAARKRVAELGDGAADSERAADLFARGQVDPEATARTQRIVAKALEGGDPAWSPEVECRGKACRVIVPGWMLGEAARDWRRRLFRDLDFRRHAMSSMDVGASGVFFTLFPDPSRPLGEEYLRKVKDAWRSSRGVAACAARHAEATGRITATFELADAERPKEGSAPGALSVTWGGSLAGSDLARCLEHEAAGLVAGAKFPPRVRGASVTAALDFPIAGR